MLGRIRQETLSFGPDLALRCTLAVPEPVGDPLPLVLALHYGWVGACPAAFYGGGVLTRLVGPALASLGALIAAPDCPGSDWTVPESEAVLAALWDYLHATYPLDDRRALVTGYSLGGMGAWHLASRYPERFRAAVVMAGWPAPGAVERLAIPLYVIHSRDDEVIPIAPTEAAVAALRDRNHPVEFVTLEDITHFEVGRFGRPLRVAAEWVQGIWGRANKR
jgi:pimeloyl-ACP methyl ester carboxylesterase